jgi:uncharacterized membrane protein YbhN (UPF0104 family)
VNRLWPALRLSAGVAVVVALVVKLGSGAVLHSVAAVDAGTVLAALALGLLATVCSAGRWCLVARRLGMALPLRTAVADCYQAVFLNSVLPAGVLGDVHRAVAHGRESGDMTRGVRAVVLERLAGQVVLVAATVGVLACEPALLDIVVPGSARWVVAGALLATVAAGWLLRARLRPMLADAATVLRPAVVGLSVLTLACYLATFVVAARAAGSAAPITGMLPILVLALLAMSLPLNVGGWGPREAATAAGFGVIGLGAAQGLATAVVYGVLSLVACLPGAVVLAVRAARRRSAPGSPAAPALSLPTQRTDDRPLPSASTPGGPGSAGAVGRPRPRLLVRSPA